MVSTAPYGLLFQQAAGRSADDREAFFQIVQNIVDMLHLHGQAAKPRRDARDHKLPVGELAVCAAGRVQHTSADIRHMHHLIGKRQAVQPPRACRGWRTKSPHCTRVVETFPDGNSALMLFCARLRILYAVKNSIPANLMQ